MNEEIHRQMKSEMGTLIVEQFVIDVHCAVVAVVVDGGVAVVVADVVVVAVVVVVVASVVDLASSHSSYSLKP